MEKKYWHSPQDWVPPLQRPLLIRVFLASWREKAATPALEEPSLLLRNNSPNCIYFTGVKGHKVKGNKNCIQLDNSIKINLSRWHSC